MNPNTEEQTGEVIPATEDGVMIRPALETLAKLRGGALMDNLSIALNEVVAAVRDCESGKGGHVNLKIKIEPVKKFPGAVSLQAIVDTKCPVDPPQSDLMFYDDDGNLHTKNPRQRDIFEGGPKSA